MPNCSHAFSGRLVEIQHSAQDHIDRQCHDAHDALFEACGHSSRTELPKVLPLIDLVVVKIARLEQVSGCDTQRTSAGSEGFTWDTSTEKCYGERDAQMGIHKIDGQLAGHMGGKQAARRLSQRIHVARVIESERPNIKRIRRL